MNIIVEINSQDDGWKNYSKINEDFFSKTVKNILSRYPNFVNIREVELSVLLTNDDQMRLLNSDFRGKDKPTNVLSFQDLEINWQQIVEFLPNQDYLYLGDIAFGYQYITNEAKKKKVDFLDHFQHLLVHAILHLMGYDHNNDEEADVMESLETEILQNFGIKSPY